jgi:murein DD-endopeptidase MepM/ murein hydrolase activator NlpD
MPGHRDNCSNPAFGLNRGRVLTAMLLALSVSSRGHGQTPVPLATPERQPPLLRIAPSRPDAGALVRITLDARPSGGDSVGSSPGDSVVEIKGSMAGEPLHFIAAGNQVWRALGAVPVDGEDSVAARVVVTRSSGAVDTVRTALAIPSLPAPSVKSSPRLAVNERFTRPLDAATRARIERENARAREVGRRAHDSPPRWTGVFLKPRGSRVTSGFGTGRAFNGAVASRHLGVDFSGAVGSPVRAANRGVVALVDTFFLAGRVIYLDHGAGVVTGYFHLSEPLVAVGDTVARGQTIGRVGATGRVTGAHLHWSARYGTLAIDPLDLVDLEEGWYEKPSQVEPPATKTSQPGSK